MTQDLIERLERASEDSHVLNAEIECLSNGWAYKGSTPDGRYVAAIEGFSQPMSPAPPFTRYVDAALALSEKLLPGYRVGVERNAHAELGWDAFVQVRWGPKAETRWKGRAATPALALCIALLRAHREGEGR